MKKITVLMLLFIILGSCSPEQDLVSYYLENSRSENVYFQITYTGQHTTWHYLEGKLTPQQNMMLFNAGFQYFVIEEVISSIKVYSDSNFSTQIYSQEPVTNEDWIVDRNNNDDAPDQRLYTIIIK